tara:strand:- start:3074 stop:4201 length:1128 start_codon:yes stop_codon:yes gene_type:complete
MNGEGEKFSLGGVHEWQFGLPVLILTISSLGILSIYSASQNVAHNFEWAPLYLKQITWVVIGGVAFLVMSAYDYHRLSRYAYVLYVLSLLLLVLVSFAGRSTRGAQRWLEIGSFSFQPSEVAKVMLVVMLARYFSTWPSTGVLHRIIIPVILMFPGFLLILLQPDLGTAITYLFVFLTIILFVGPWTRSLIFGFFGILMVLPFLWKGLWMPLRAYQKERILAFLDPTLDPMGQGYQALQSKIAIGSGQLSGQGLYGATQSQLQFLPDGYTDFAFAVFAEQWGFLGVVILLFLYYLLFMMMIGIGERAKDLFGVILVIGITAMLSFCLMVNIGMTVGLLPIVGIPLPLMSYGGTTLVMTFAVLGLLLNIKRRRFSS